ncbi:MAG: HAD family hydrolase [Oscillospiraceae bacterium]|jgi:Cof subfamily protein (haloacid dehalogenase superfamily)|nr:HAD family hydrolase [Oscillospiraceae bacterium]
MKTLYISDLDGTLLNREAVLSPFTRDTLNALIDDGLNFSVATARSDASVNTILAGLRMNLPVSLMNGVIIYDMAEKRYERVLYLPLEASEATVKAMRETGMTAFMYELRDGVFRIYHESLESAPMRAFVKERVKRYQKEFRHTESFSDVSFGHIIYFTLLDTFPRVCAVKDLLADTPGITMTLYRDIYSDGLWYLEIFSAAASKQTAAEYLRERYGFDRVVGLGDNLNDLPLFRACDTRVAVENAAAELKSAADFICASNENDGVAKWLLEKHLRESKGGNWRGLRP